jgi:hypothetical protein
VFTVTLGHCHNDPVEQFGRSLEDIQMAVGDGIEASRIYRRAHGTDSNKGAANDEQEKPRRYPLER